MNIQEIGNALENLKDLQSHVEDLNEKEQLVHLRSVFVDMKQEIIDLREENYSLKQKHHEASAHQTLLDSLIEVDGFFYDKDGENKPVGYPYCPMCLRKENGPFKMLRLAHNASVCPNCNSRFRAGADGKINIRRPDAKSAFAAQCSRD